MAWSNLPAALGFDYTKYANHKQFYLAIYERARMTGATTWPPPTFIWPGPVAVGTVSSLVNNNNGTYTVNITGSPLTSGRWYNYSRPPGDTTTPQFYDLIIDNPNDVTQCLHLQIQGNTTSAFTVTDTPIADALTSKFVSGLSAWTGLNVYIIRRGGLWGSDRWFDFPNDEEAENGLSLAAGAILQVSSLTSSGTTATVTTAIAHGGTTGDTVTIAGATPSAYNGAKTITVTGATTFTYTATSGLTSPATGTITARNPNVGANDSSGKFPVGTYASGYELMVRGSDGYLKRLTVTGNDGTNLIFARQSFTVSGQYGVVATGSKWRMINSDCRPHAGYIPRWYNSANPGTALTNAFDTYWALSAVDNTLGATRLLKKQIQLLGGASCTTPFFQTILDTDYSTSSTDPCNTPDAYTAPDFYKSIRGLQVCLENLCTFFLNKNVNYAGASAIPLFVPATWFAASSIGLNWTTTTGSLDNTGGTGGIDYTAVGLPSNLVGTNLYYAILDFDNTVINYGIGYIDRDGHLNYDPTQSPFASADVGKTLVLATGWTRKFERGFQRMYTATILEPYVGGGALLPISPTNPGTPTNYQPSQKYREVSDIGIVDDTAGVDSFTVGDVARYQGTNENDPNVQPATLTSDTTGMAAYYAGAAETTLPPVQQAAVEASKVGTVTSGTSFSIQDTSKNWWPDGVAYTDTGTFNSGSTTTGGDSTKSGSGFWGNGTFGSTTYLSNLIAQITIGGVEYRRPIFNYFGTLTLTFSNSLPSSANGEGYQIRIPTKRWNRWQGRKLKLTFPNGTQYTVTINQSDDNSLYFNDIGVTIPAGTAYQIQENYPSGCWQWNGSAWVVPAGNDPRNSQPWPTNQKVIVPFFVTRYGRHRKFDMPFLHVWNELYQGIQQLYKSKWPLSWTANGMTNTSVPPEQTGIVTFSTAQSQCQSDFGNATYQHSTNGQPYSVAYTDSTCGGSSVACYSYGLGRRFSYGLVSNLQLFQNYTVEYWDKAAIPTNLDGVSSSTTLQNFGCPALTTFDSQGDAVMLNVWDKWDTKTSSSGTALSAALGSLATPNAIGPVPINCASSPGSFCNQFAGYTVTDQTAILIGVNFVYQ